MSYNLSVQVEAVLEMQEAFDWYEQQKEGLGYELLEEIESCFNSLLSNPHRYSYINQLYRRIKTKRFPYLLIYEVEGDDIIVVNIRHVKRNS